MRKIITLGLALTFTLAFTACDGNADEVASTTKAIPTTNAIEISETIQETEAAQGIVGDKTNLDVVHIDQYLHLSDLHSAGFLNQYDSFHEYTAEHSGEWIVVWTEQPLTEFALVEVDFMSEPELIPGQVVFSIGDLLPEKPFVANVVVPCGIPMYGITYIKDGEQYFSPICEGGELL